MFSMPSEFAMVILFRPETGAPYAIINGTSTTWMRTGAVTAIGAKYLACDKPKVLGHIGARGTAWYNVAVRRKLCYSQAVNLGCRKPLVTH
jgi:alanine dehydrogenase